MNYVFGVDSLQQNIQQAVWDDVTFSASLLQGAWLKICGLTISAVRPNHMHMYKPNVMGLQTGFEEQLQANSASNFFAVAANNER